MKVSTSSHGLRLRQKHDGGHKTLKQECRSALLSVCVIAAVWSFWCWLLIWWRLYRSFNTSTSDVFEISTRRDVLAARLKQLSDATDTVEANDVSFTSNNTWILEKLSDPRITKQVRRKLIADMQYPQLILGAYLEPPLKTDDKGFLQLRTHAPNNLTHVLYPFKKNDKESTTMGACSQSGAQWILPTFHPSSMDYYFEGNVFRKKPMFDKRWELASGIDSTSSGYCPVDADPFLPWIQDVFPSRDGSHIEFVISNKRRCNTDPNVFQSDLKNLEAQVALMQPIPVKRAKDDVRSISGLWNAKPDNIDQSADNSNSPPTYVLATSLDDADEDAKFTRFICRFHTVTLEEGKEQQKLKPVILGETLSNYPYSPEHANYLKRGSKPMLTSIEQGHDEQIWNSVYSIRCPVPELSDGMRELTTIIASGESVTNGVPSIYVDLIPIRTPVRTNREGLRLSGTVSSQFDPKLVWGDVHVLPRVEASGRWSNIPICMPSLTSKAIADNTSKPPSSDSPSKTHFLVGCMWASRSFSTRGQAGPTDSSTSDRLLEFLAYHINIAGFDHIYVYDNSDTTTGNATLAPVIDLFPEEVVTRIPWPHRICNNNRPANSNPGERSSQYAAEASCRARYGDSTEWLISMDADEYLIPVGKRGIKDWLMHVNTTEKDTKILSFFQTRALPIIDLMMPYNGTSTKSCKVDLGVAGNTADATCAMKDPAKTYMETYNCEPTRHPKPQSWAWRAKKQIYKPDFVLNHFVHYSLVTKLIEDKPLEVSPRFQVQAPYERRVNELTEGFMLHTKTTSPEMTSNWQNKCPRKGDKAKSSCTVGIPSAEILGTHEHSVYDKTLDAGAKASHYEPNCYRHSRVMELVPELEKAIQSIKAKNKKHTGK